jgi:hypothetical protein
VASRWQNASSLRDEILQVFARSRGGLTVTRRFWVHLGVTVSTALVTGAIVSACAHNDASLFIRQVLAPTIPANGTCSYTADPTQNSISVGAADLSFASLSTYSPVFLVGNQIISQANVDQDQAETSRIIINGAITRITDLAGGNVISLLQGMCSGAATGTKDDAACTTGQQLGKTLAAPINPFSTVEAGAIEPGTGTTASYGTIQVTIVDSGTIDLLRAYFVNSIALNGAAAFQTSIQLLTYTKVEGSTLGGDPQESNEFEFPVTLTYGGLVQNLVSDPLSAAGVCLDTEVTVPTTAQTCVLGQDVGVIVGAVSDPAIADCPLPADGGVVTVDAAGLGDDAGG